jgi:TENA/THI-4/PQQC family
MADGLLAEAAFRHYLGQDYLFLIEFARAYALAVYKAPKLADMREAAAGLSAILDVEMNLHLKLCAGWGLSPHDLERAPPAIEMLAYTRYVLGMLRCRRSAEWDDLRWLRSRRHLIGRALVRADLVQWRGQAIERHAMVACDRKNFAVMLSAS